MWKRLKKQDPEIFEAVCGELTRQKENLELIASENFASSVVLNTQSSVMNNKYAEGYPGARWYGGCEWVDRAEELACSRTKELFGIPEYHINVQPHSGTQTNMAVMLAVLKPGDRILSMDLSAGGHLSHGHKLNFAGRLYEIIPYGVSRETECLDYDQIRKLALENKPKLIITGASAYPRFIDFKKFKEIADEAGALLLADIAHIAGLIAADVHPSCFPYADFVTTTTHKTLRGPRGGIIMVRKEFAKKIDTAVFPGAQGGPFMHVIAAKAVCLKEAKQEVFKEYQRQIQKNAKALASSLDKLGYRIVTGGTDNHMLLVDLTPKGLTGKEASMILGKVNITVNKNLIPFDVQPPAVASGVRLGTPALTTRGMKELQMQKVAELIDRALMRKDSANELAAVSREVAVLTKKFPLYPERKYG